MQGVCAIMTWFCKCWGLFPVVGFPINASLSRIVVRVEWLFWSAVPYGQVPITFLSFYSIPAGVWLLNIWFLLLTNLLFGIFLQFSLHTVTINRTSYSFLCLFKLRSFLVLLVGEAELGVLIIEMGNKTYRFIIKS